MIDTSKFRHIPWGDIRGGSKELFAASANFLETIILKRTCTLVKTDLVYHDFVEDRIEKLI